MVHFGVGGFHRSHQQVFLDELLRAHFDESKDWAYAGIGVLPGDAHMRDYLIKNNYTYPVVSREGEDGRVGRWKGDILIGYATNLPSYHLVSVRPAV